MQLQAATLSRFELLDAAIDAAERAGKFLQSHFGEGNGLTFKEKHDVQLDEDLKAEEIARLCLCDVSEYAFIGEESYEEVKWGRHAWVVDPLDGTANYARGIPHFATSIALIEDGVPVLGVVRNHATGELMTAMSGNGAWMDGVRLNVSKTNSLDKSILSGGFMKTDEAVQRNMEFIAKAVRRTFKLRITGAAALDLCNVAMGRFDIYSEKGIRIWDISAGLLIANEAGASISISKVDDISYDVTVLSPTLENEFVEAFPETAPFRKTIPNLMDNG